MKGRYHQSSACFNAVGNRVRPCTATAWGAIALDPILAPGEYRPLTAG